MKCINHLVRLIAVMVMLAVSVCSLIATQKQNGRGEYSEVCGRISAEAEQQIRAQFTDCETPRAFFDALLEFGCQNFTYTRSALNPLQKGLQYFDLDQFIQSGYRGVCFDFSCFSKVAALIWAEEKGVDLRAYEYDFSYDSGKHSINIFEAEGKTYYMDITCDVGEYKKKVKPLGAVCIGAATPKEFLAASYKGFKLMAVR